MLTVLFWIGLMVETLLTYRAISGGLYAKYPFFFAHIASGLVATIVCYMLILTNPRAYETYYWMAQFLTMITGCGIILEILRHVLSSDPIARKYATALQRGLYLAIACIVTIYLWTLAGLSGNISNLNLERNFRLVQSFFLLAMLGLIFYRGLVMGKNLKGMFLGYGVYVAASLVILAVRSYGGPALEGAWEVVQPLAYFICLSIWLFSLWAYYPAHPGQAYSGSVSSDTLLGGARPYPSKAVRT